MGQLGVATRGGRECCVVLCCVRVVDFLCGGSERATMSRCRLVCSASRPDESSAARRDSGRSEAGTRSGCRSQFAVIGERVDQHALGSEDAQCVARMAMEQ